MKIKDLPKIDRPREKFEKYGPEKLSNPELLAILLRTGAKGVNVVELSNKILKKFSSDGLSKANFKEHFVVFFLDSRNQEIKHEIVSIGRQAFGY